MDSSESVNSYILYTLEGCGRCKILKAMLDNKNINYIESSEFSEGWSSAPVLAVPNGSFPPIYMAYLAAVNYVNSL